MSCSNKFIRIKMGKLRGRGVIGHGEDLTEMTGCIWWAGREGRPIQPGPRCLAQGEHKTGDDDMPWHWAQEIGYTVLIRRQRGKQLFEIWGAQGWCLAGSWEAGWQGTEWQTVGSRDWPRPSVGICATTGVARSKTDSWQDAADMRPKDASK